MTPLTPPSAEELLKEAEWREWVVSTFERIDSGRYGLDVPDSFGIRDEFITPLREEAARLRSSPSSHD